MDEAAFKTLVQELGKACADSDAPAAVKALVKFPQMPPEPTLLVYNVAIGTCVRAGKLPEAVALLNQLFMSKKTHVQPNHLTYNLLIFGAARAGDWPQAETFRDEMLEARLMPDEHTFTGLLLACGKGKDPAMVHELLKQMMGPKLLPTYTTAIAALARCGDLKGALALLRKMKEDDGLSPSPEAYHAAMFACTKGGDAARWTECLDLLREMQAQGLPVGLTAYNTALLSAGMAGETEAAQRLMDEIKKGATGGLAPQQRELPGPDQEPG